MTLLPRLRAALHALTAAPAASGVVQRGSIAPFDKLFFTDGVVGDQLKESYANSVWVQRAIKFVAGPISAVPLCFYEGDTEVESPELHAFWQRPAVGLTFSEFVTASVGWLKLKGEVFYLLGDDALVPFPEQQRQWSPLIVARPDAMDHVVQNGELVGWRYRDAQGKQHPLLPDQVIHVRAWNPYDAWRGLGELEAAYIAADADYLAGKFERNLMRNNGDRGPIVSATNGVTDEQRDAIVAALRQKAYSTAAGNFRPLFLTNDVKVQDPQVLAPDANFVASRLHKRHEIMLAFGVPPSMADVVASYSVGSASDRFRLIEDTCMPASAQLADAIGRVASRQTGRSLVAEFDWDEHTVMQQVRAERLASAKDLFDRGWAWQEINDYLRLGAKPFRGWERRYLPFSLQEVGSAPAAPVQPPGTPAAMDTSDGEDSPVVDELAKLFASRNAHGGLQPPPHVCAAADEYAASIEGAVRTMKARARKFFFEQRARVLRELDKRKSAIGNGQSTIAKALGDDIFNQEFENQAIRSSFQPVLLKQFEFGGVQLWQEYGLGDFVLPPKAATDYLAKAGTRWEEINGLTHTNLRETLIDGLNNGESFDQLADRVRAVFDAGQDIRADTIALTETNTAINAGRHESLMESPLELKVWMSANLENSRPEHQDAGERYAQGIPKDQPFVLANGAKLMFPGDSSLGAGPGDTINCKCHMGAVSALKTLPPAGRTKSPTRRTLLTWPQWAKH